MHIKTFARLALGVLVLCLLNFQPFPSAWARHASRLQGALEQLVEASRLAPQQLDALATQRGASVSGGRVAVVVEARTTGDVLQLQKLLVQQGAEAVGSFQRLIKARVSLSQLPILARVPGVDYVRLPYTPRPASTTSEGVALIGAQAYQRAGLGGRGVKIAVIDLGFDGLAEAFANGDLPDQLEQFDFTRSGMGGIAHGTAVAEIVHDVAPQATLLLMKIANEVDLGVAVSEAIRQGARVINHSVVWYNTEYGDGRGGVAQVAAQAVARGVVWVNAAGNGALLHWQGVFRDADDDSWVDFDPFGAETLSLQAIQGEQIEVFLNWDAWPQTSFDYDLFLTEDFNGNGLADPEEPFVSSVDPQRGLDPPSEQLTWVAPVSGHYLISVWYKGTLSPPPLEIFTTQHTLRSPVRRGSVLAPATAEGVLAVGAVAQTSWGSGLVQPFSAQGPTSDGRTKPDLVAPDEVSNFTASRFPLQFGVDGRFVGTSAAAPHVSGAVALLIEDTPVISPNEVYLALARNALQRSPVQPDNQSGFGQIHLTLSPTLELSPTLSELTVSATTVETGQDVTVSVQAHNPHSRALSTTLPLLLNGQTVAAQEVVLAPDETRVVTFSWRFTKPGTFTLGAGSLVGIRVRVVEALQLGTVSAFVNGNHAFSVNVQGIGIERVRLELYDLAGRQVLAQESDTKTFSLPLSNALGQPLANGVYLYSISVFGTSNAVRLPLKKLLILF